MTRLQRFIQCERQQLKSTPAWLWVVVFVVVVFWGAAKANSDELDPKVADAVIAKLTDTLSKNAGIDVPVESITATEAQGLLEVVLENGLTLYVDESASHFVVGDLYAIRDTDLVNLTEQKRETNRKALIDSVNIEDMIVFSPEGDVRDYIMVFTDVTCFYCQKLHKEVEALNDAGIEVRYLAYPRAGVDSDGAKKLSTAWCAKDRQGTLTKLKAGAVLPVNACDDSPVSAQYELGSRLGVRGTPAIITSSGEMIPGYKSADQLERVLGLN